MNTGFFKRWLSADGYLGLHLTAGFLLAAICGSLFGEIAEDVFFKSNSYLAADAFAQSVVKQIESPGLTTTMRIITKAGDPITLTILSAIVICVLLTRHSRRRLYTFAAIMMGGSLLNFLLKDAFQRSRPDMALRLILVSGYSFPSGHSMGSMLFYGGLAYVLFFSVPRSWTLRIVGIVVCLLLVLSIGSSRVYLGVHYLSDVAAGFTAGLAWIGICITGTEIWIRLRDRRKAASAQRETLNPA